MLLCWTRQIRESSVAAVVVVMRRRETESTQLGEPWSDLGVVPAAAVVVLPAAAAAVPEIATQTAAAAVVAATARRGKITGPKLTGDYSVVVAAAVPLLITVRVRKEAIEHDGVAVLPAVRHVVAVVVVAASLQ